MSDNIVDNLTKSQVEALQRYMLTKYNPADADHAAYDAIAAEHYVEFVESRGIIIGMNIETHAYYTENQWSWVRNSIIRAETQTLRTAVERALDSLSAIQKKNLMRVFFMETKENGDYEGYDINSKQVFVPIAGDPVIFYTARGCRGQFQYKAE